MPSRVVNFLAGESGLFILPRGNSLYSTRPPEFQEQTTTMDITNQELLDLSTRIERQGLEFYTELAKFITDPEVKEVLNVLAKEETMHECQFTKLLDLKGDRSFGWEESDPLRKIINTHYETDIFPKVEDFFKHVPQLEGIRKAFDYAMEVEKTSAEFYGLLQKTCTDLETKTLLVLLEKAEREHIVRVKTLRDKYNRA